LIGGTYNNPVDGEYLVPWDVLTTGTLGNAEIPVSSGTASKLFVRTSSALSGGDSLTVELYKNGAATGLTCTINQTQSACSDTVTSVSFADGDLLAIRYDEVSSPGQRVKLSFLYQAP